MLQEFKISLVDDVDYRLKQLERARTPTPAKFEDKLKDREGDQRGGEWEPIKILLENLADTPNPSRNPSLLARPRPSSYRLAIGPRNRARNRN
jgi:hypothetical protein